MGIQGTQNKSERFWDNGPSFPIFVLVKWPGMKTCPKMLLWLVVCCFVLHSILRSLLRDSYTSSKSVDVINDEGELLNGAWRDEDQGPKATYSAEEVRDHFKEYFQTFPWQRSHGSTNIYIKLL